MPTYEYKCDNCGHGFEIYQSMKDEKLTKCPNCGKNTLKRLIGSGGGVIFKGSGFYLTDYKNKPESKTSTKAGAEPSKKENESSKSSTTEKVATKETSEKSSKKSANSSTGKKES